MLSFTVLTSLVFALMNQTPHLEEFYIGTYTSPKGSKGIYHCTLDTTTGKLGTPTLVAEAASPSYVALSADRKHLYAVLESTDGDVNAYKIGAGGKLTLQNSQKSSGPGACHLSIDRSGKWLFTASYNSGRFSVLPIKADGSLGRSTCTVQNKGSGPDQSRQEGPHLHSIYADAKNKFVYALDLGTDEILINQFDSKAGMLLPAIPGAQKSPGGAGPRHLAFNPKANIAYVNNEMENSVQAYSINTETGALTEIQTISTTLDGVRDKGNTTAEIVCHFNGRWLYVSNRGDDTIAVYHIGVEPPLHKAEVVSLPVKTPRGFDIDPSGKWLVVGGQSTNDLVAMKIDQKTGKLEPTSQKVSVGAPVCVVFRR